MTDPETMQHRLAPTADPTWVFGEEGFDPNRERIVGSRFVISNGFLGVRGARWGVPGRTYVAGLFDTAGTGHATRGLVPAPDWLRVCILLQGRPLTHHPAMTLVVRRGALLSEGRHLKAPDLDFHMHTLHLLSISGRAIGLQLIRLEIAEGEVDVTVEASFEGVDPGLVTDRLDQDLGVWQTRHAGHRLAMASVASLQIDGQDRPPTALGPLKWSWSWKTRPGQVVCFQRLVAAVRSDTPDRDPGIEAREKLDHARHAGWRNVVAAHEAAWLSRWHSSDIKIEGDADAQRALRFAVYHLNSAANPADERVSIGARALTGDEYHGHVFWDTEIFLLPFYSLTWPEAARTLLSTTQLGTKTIAARCGFGSPPRMARAFERALGIAPRAYRAMFPSAAGAPRDRRTTA